MSIWKLQTKPYDTDGISSCFYFLNHKFEKPKMEWIVNILKNKFAEDYQMSFYMVFWRFFCFVFFQLILTSEQHDMLTNDCTDESGELCSQSWQPHSQLQLTLSTGSDQTSQKRDCFSSRAWPVEIKPEVGLMPAGTINLLFISNLLDHLGPVLIDLCQGREKKVNFCK